MSPWVRWWYLSRMMADGGLVRCRDMTFTALDPAYRHPKRKRL